MRYVLAALLLASPALAEDGLRWGTPIDPASGPNALRLIPCDGGACAAQVTFHNSQLRGAALTRRFTLEVAGLAVAVTVTEGELRAPDEIAVTPPPGFTAEPAHLAVEEDATGVVLIRPVPLS